jgi:proline iminopeptidase
MHVQVGDVRLFFDVEGTRLAPDGPVMRERPTLVCLHGGPGNDHSSFRPAYSALANVAQVVYLDQRGHGRSDRSDPRRWSLAQWAEDLYEFCGVLGIEQPVVLGNSFGGYVAMTYAVRYPDRLSKLILLSTAARGTGDVERCGRVFSAFERLGGTEARDVVRRAFAQRSPEAFAEYLRVCGPLYTRRQPDPEARKRAVTNDAVLPTFERAGGEGVTFDIQAELAKVSCPTLVIGGEDDPITPIEEQQLIADLLPPDLVRFERVPRCGHGIVRDEPERLFQLISEFVVT